MKSLAASPPPVENWESIGIREGWVENGWTENQMMDRIKELGLMNIPVMCVLSPYYLNFLQNPDTNTLVKETVQTIRPTLDTDSSDGDGDREKTYAKWIAASNLWSRGQTINIVFSNSTAKDFIMQTLIKDLQPHVSMKLAFPSGTTGDILVNVAPMSGVGGNSQLGRVGRQQTINLNSSSMGNANVTSLKAPAAVWTPEDGYLDEIVNKAPDDAGKNTAGNAQGSFNWARYLVTHEFGHAMGLWHEWNREQCGRNGVTCSPTQDPYSVMNYPAGSSGGASDAKPSANTKDTYSDADIAWLQSVYGGTGKPTDPPRPTDIIPNPITIGDIGLLPPPVTIPSASL